MVLGLKECMAKTASPPSVLEPQCPSRLVLDRIADKWTALVIQILASGTMRYAELQRAIGGVSQKMLTQTLRSLERDGLVRRVVHPVVPPKVEYSLTKLGRTLIEPLQGLCRWSEKHLAELQANRARAKTVDADTVRLIDTCRRLKSLVQPIRVSGNPNQATQRDRNNPPTARRNRLSKSHIASANSLQLHPVARHRLSVPVRKTEPYARALWW